jgi:hypothetical protein
MSRAFAVAASLGLALAALAGCRSSSPTPSPTPGFSVTGSMSVSRASATATLLPGGRVLIAGGYRSTEAHELTYWSSAELYDPASGAFSVTGSMAAARAGATATLLPGGKILIAGGYRVEGAMTVAEASAELYDPASGTFSVTGSMAEARYRHTATLLADGRVLVAGGTGDRATLASAELYDPVSGTFGPAGSMTTARVGHTATRLGNDQILIAGGSQAVAPADATYLASAELYDPAGGTFTATGSMADARYGPVAVRLPDGRVLVAGGMRYVLPPAKVSLSTAEVYDAAGSSAGYVDLMRSARTSPICVLLPSGKVLIAGGMIVDTPSSPASYLASAELFDPETGTFDATASMATGRIGAVAALLADGRVLVVGGGGPEATLASAEIYQP